MRTVSIKLKDMAIANIQLGFVGENNATQVIFESKEIFDENPYAVQLLVVTPPEGTSYEVTTARIGDNVIWNVSELDTAFEGDGSIQLVFTDGSQVIKTYNADTTVLESQVPSGTAPATALNWIQDAEAWAKGTRGGRAVEDDDPTYQNNSKYYSDKIVNMASDSEAWAKGTRDGEAVESDDPAYHNNSKYYAESIADTASDSEAYAAGTRGGEAVDEDDPAYHNNAAYYNEQAALEKAAAQAAAETASAAYNVNLLAANYDATKTYAVGEYVIYNGGLYRCISAITTAEAWTAAHWSSVTVGKDTSALKSAFEVNVTKYLNDWKQGTLNSNGGVSTSSTRCRIEAFIGFDSGVTAFLLHIPSGKKISYREYTSASVSGFTKMSDWMETDTEIKVVPGHYFRFVIAFTDDATITPEDIAQNSVSYEEILYIDKTLTMGGKAADAKKVGDEIAQINGALLVQNVAPLAWESGTINTNGNNQDSTTRIRTSSHVFTKGFEAVIPSGMKLSTRVYSIAGVFEGYTDWTTGTLAVTLQEPKQYRFVAAYDDDSEISAIAGSGIEITEIHYFDKTLTMSGKAADSKATGDAIGNVETETGILFDALSQAKGITKFIQGSIATDNGTNVSSTTRIRSSGYQNFESDMVEISVSEGYKFSIREYSSPSLVPAEIQASFIQALPSGNGWCTDKYTLHNTFGKYYRFVVAKSDESAITPSDATSANLVASVLKKPNEVSAYSVAGNNLLGNVSIRAAKTIMFNDGTPPVIDWYLLQDVNNNFYRSKDLTDKQYLFTFEAPTSTTSNWSCGIDGNNNIFFVKDAAGYTDDDGPRLDDAKRENPIFFKAEDNYTSQNELDFGEDFKPAGWLTNVGWCVLPNGDVVFCEYTRGTLKTCNVWHIDGADTTDPENWTVTWSHDIIDSTSATALGMKHCHTVQYDFYTGICYFSTGDSSDGSFIYHSLDNGETWELTYGANRDRCRQLSFVFTAGKVYWASDSYDAADHNFFIADRDENGVIDVENARKVVIGLVNNQACYGCVYLQSLGFIAFMDRNDTGDYDTFIFKGYDIANDEIVTIGEWGMVDGGRAGFRTKFTEWYPTGASIKTGFNPKSGSVTPDTNVNALCGNLGGSSGDGSTRVNNLILHIGRDANGVYSVRASSIYV